MVKKPNKNTEPKTQSVPDLPVTANEAAQVKGGATLAQATATGKIIPKVEIHIL